LHDGWSAASAAAQIMVATMEETILMDFSVQI